MMPDKNSLNLIFTLEKFRFAVPVCDIVEVVRLPEHISVDKAELFLGNILYNDNKIPLLNIGKRLGMDRTGMNCGYALVASVSAVTFAFPVHTLDGIISSGKRSYPFPGFMLENSGVIRSVIDHDEKLAFVIEIEKIIDHECFSCLDEGLSRDKQD